MSDFSPGTVSYSLPLLPCCPLWKEVTVHSRPSRRVELCAVFLRTEYLDKLFGIWHGGFVSSLFIYSAINLCQYGFMGIYTLRYKPIMLYFIARLVQLLPLGALSVGSCVLLTHQLSVSFYFEHFLTFWHYRMLQPHLAYFLPQSLNIFPFFQAAVVPFIGEWY